MSNLFLILLFVDSFNLFSIVSLFCFTFLRWSSFRDIVVKRNDSRQSSDVRLNSQQSSDQHLNSRQSSNSRQSPKISLTKVDAEEDRKNTFCLFAGSSTQTQKKDQFCGSTPILFSKQRPLIGELGSASPTPHPRNRRARSETEHRPGSFKTRKGPPPKPPSPASTDPQTPLSSPPPLAPPDPFPFNSTDPSTIRRASDQSQDEGVIISPASVVKALAPLLAPVFAVVAIKNGMTNKSRYSNISNIYKKVK